MIESRSTQHIRRNDEIDLTWCGQIAGGSVLALFDDEELTGAPCHACEVNYVKDAR